MVESLVFLALCVLLGRFLFKKYHEHKNNKQDKEKISTLSQQASNLSYQIQQIEEELSRKTAMLQGVTQQAEKVTIDIEKLKADERVANERAMAAAALAEKSLEVEAARRRDEFERNLSKEFNELEKASSKAALTSELKEINKEIEVARKTLTAVNLQRAQEQEQEDFDKYHSVNLSPQDKHDIELFREFAPSLNKTEAVFKLIWNEYYIKEFQALRKKLGADGKTGIYKITNQKNRKSYIGQALKIGEDRWMTHIKNGLGIGKTTSELYKDMFEIGPEFFNWEILEECPSSQLNVREKYWIDFFDTAAFGYNIRG